MSNNQNEKPKLSGMEMMMNSLLRAAGFDPKELTSSVTVVVSEIQGGLKATVERMTAIEAETRRNRLLLEHIIRELKIPPFPAGEVLPPVALLNSENHPDN